MPSQVENKGWTSVYYYPEEAVDLGLSVRWASMNVGASNQYDDGIYTSWGDAYGTNTSTSSSYNNDVHEIVGNPAYDIATNLWNERWQIPTREQWEELINNCTWTYAYDSERKVYGYTITAVNGNSIYLPFYFYTTGENIVNGSSYTSGYYWSSTEYSSSNKAYALELTSSSKYIDYNSKYYRMQVRPVLVK